MHRHLAFLYGLVAYVAGLLTLAGLASFCANLGLPRSVDIGPGTAWPQALFTDLALIVFFGLQHSLMARPRFKQWWTRIVPPALERSTFVLASCAALALLAALWRPITDVPVWQVRHPLGAVILWGLCALGWLLAVAASFQIDHFELFGLKQACRELRRASPPPAQFVTPLLYRHVRHPLYLGLLLGFWATPDMTPGHLLLALGFTLYILVGIRFEERDLLRQFGPSYHAYRQQVGMLLPRGWVARRPDAQAHGHSTPANPS